MFSVSYFRHGRWHCRLFWDARRAVRYADTFPLMPPGSFRVDIPGY